MRIDGGTSAVALVTVFVGAALLGAAPTSASERPNARLTPGAVGLADGSRPSASAVCAPGYARSARHPYDAEWRRYRTAMFREYGLPHELWSSYTVDHLIPIELGGLPFGVNAGAWDLRNVWPEPKAEAEQKDAVENALRAAVCNREGYRGIHLTLEQAQRAIATDWSTTPVGMPPIERFDESR